MISPTRQTQPGAEFRPEDPILVVDDIWDNCQVVRRRLELRGYPVVCASSGQQALELLVARQVSLILLDVMMPVMSGYEVLEAMQEQLGERSPPVIMLTARDSPDEIARAIELGAADYVTKPFDFRVLEARIRAQLRRAHSAGALRMRATELEAHVQTLHHRQRLDPLTGLPNLREFETVLSRHLARARSNAETHVLCVCALDELQAINYTYGPAVGDAVLRTVAGMLQEELGDGDRVARLRGDKFAIVYTNADVAQALGAAERLVQRITSHTIAAGEELLTLSASLGLTPMTPDHASVMALIHSAEHGCKLARAEGTNQIRVYRSEDHQLESLRTNMRWSMKVKQALKEDNLVLYAQPIVACRQEHEPPRRFEVLVRLLDEGRVVSPGLFLDAVEQHGLATDLDRWVLEHTLRFLEELPATAREATEKISINLSGHSIGNSSFRDFVVQRLRSASVAPSLICFEITETAAVVHLDRAISFIRSLQKLGVEFALDDFGAGVSSFGYLRTLPVDCLKVDGQFVRNIESSPLDRGIVTAINQIAHIMGMITVAEFVEDQQTVTALGSIGVDYLQGYHLGRPEPLHTYLGSARDAATGEPPALQ